MKNIIIFGGKGNGTVVAETIKLINNQKPTFNLIGYVNNNYSEQHEIEGFPVLGDFDNLEFLLKLHNAYFINAISSVKTMEIVVNKFKNNPHISDRLITIIHPDVIICDNVSIGDGSFVAPQTYIGQNTKIGQNCFVHGQAYIARDSTLNDFVYLAPKTYIGAEATLGKACYLGVGAMIRERITIGKYSIIGMGSVVVENIVDRVTVFGVKAKIK
jgi:acetyltransferase EpsM